MLTTKIVKPQDAGEPDEFEKTISQVCLEYFLSAVRIIDFASDGFFFASMVLSRAILFFYANGLDARLAESSAESPYNWA